MSLTNKTIAIPVSSRTSRTSTGASIRSGDTGAYVLDIEWIDVDAITGTCQLHFTLADGTSADRDASDGVTITGNHVTYTLEPALYAAKGLRCYVQFINSNLYTPLLIEFGGIEVVPGGTPVASAEPYPTWAAAMRSVGAYSALTAYAVGNHVTYSGGYYRCIVATTAGTLPTDTDYWILVASKGDTGATGPTGATGAQGIQGDAGTITAGSTNTAMTGLVAGDGSKIQAPTSAQVGALPMPDAGNLFPGLTTLNGQMQSAGSQLAQKVPLTRQTKYWNRPAAYKIKVAAGRFNMSWNNTSGRLWIFPAGTVLYSDGTTPIRTSTAEKPDVTIPAGGGYVWLVSAMWNGLYTLNDNDTNAVLTGALSDLPPLTNFLSLAGCTQVTGALSDLPPLTYYLSLSGCAQVTGALSDLPPLTNYLSLANCTLVTGALSDLPPLTNTLSLDNCTLVTGALSDLPPLTNFLSLAGCTQVTGALSDLPPLTNFLNLSGCSLVTGAYTAVNGNNVPTTTTLTGTGLSSDDMDATLIAYAACTKKGGTFTATGKTRTTASDAAVLHLTTPTGSGGLGWAVTGLTVV